MFLCLHAAGLTCCPPASSATARRMGAANPADIMIPCIVTSFVGTLGRLFIVASGSASTCSTGR
jgi:spore maturation protein SpmA